MTSDPTYYTHHIAYQPVRRIWRNCVQLSPLLSPLKFVQYLILKCFRINTPAIFAVCGNVTSPIVAADEVPESIQDAFAPVIRQFERHGLRVAFFMKSPMIGHKRGYSVTMLDATGTVRAAAVADEVKFGKVHRLTIYVSCHSLQKNGVELHSVASTEKNPASISYLYPKTHLFLPLPVSADPSDIYHAHLEWLTRIDVELCRFDFDSLQGHMTQAMQTLLDHLIAIGHYRPISTDEVERLRSFDFNGAGLNDRAGDQE